MEAFSKDPFESVEARIISSGEGKVMDVTGGARSVRKHAVALRFSNTAVRHILHLVLKFHSYKMAIVQKLHAQDWENRVNCWKHILTSYRYSLISDEAHFHLTDCVNKQNF